MMKSEKFLKFLNSLAFFLTQSQNGKYKNCFGIISFVRVKVWHNLIKTNRIPHVDLKVQPIFQKTVTFDHNLTH